MEFDSASKRHASEMKRRREAAKRKLEAKKDEDNLAAQLENEQIARRIELDRIEEENRQRALEEERMTMGIRYHRQLKVIPTGRPDDKVVLPPSCLEELVHQGAWDRSAVLTFRLQCSTGVITHCGVAEFTAEEGTIGVGVKVILSLGDEPPEDVSVRYIVLPRFEKTKVTFQPRGAGFHANADIVNLDIRKLLERTLSTHTTLTEHDTVVLRHNNQDFYLRVAKLEPQAALVVLNTEMEVDLLPSEAVEAEQRHKEQLEKQRAGRERQRELEIERRRQVTPLSGVGAKLIVRLPTGSSAGPHTFPEDATIDIVYQWLMDLPDLVDLTPPFGRQFELVQSWPGHRLVLRKDGKSLAEYGLRPGRAEALLLQPIGDVVEAPTEVQGEVPSVWSPQPMEAQWSSAADQAASTLEELVRADSHSKENVEAPNADVKVAAFHKLKIVAPDFPTAAKWAQKWAGELMQLEDMGFTLEQWPAAVRLLEKYQGRLVRVVNGLADGNTETPMDVDES
eukprot:GEMP01030921.1.p1 GENE.GEMP01030921.1~~GEMP01030921.1.p1  ORF type:complete len:509 (+),score=112.70 GEMP01030921.1:68-1594(+)